MSSFELIDALSSSMIQFSLLIFILFVLLPASLQQLIGGRILLAIHNHAKQSSSRFGQYPATNLLFGNRVNVHFKRRKWVRKHRLTRRSRSESTSAFALLIVNVAQNFFIYWISKRQFMQNLVISNRLRIFRTKCLPSPYLKNGLVWPVNIVIMALSFFE